MPDDQPRISDPESIFSRLDEAVKSVGALEGLLNDLEGAKDRLGQLERRLVDGIRESTDAATSATDAESALRARSEAAEELLRTTLSELATANERGRHELEKLVEDSQSRVESSLSNLRESGERFEQQLDDRVSDGLDLVEDRLEATKEAAQALADGNERFRAEQLTKLDDLRTSHGLLSDRQRESEDRLGTENARLRRKVEQLEQDIEESLEANDALSENVDAIDHRLTSRTESAASTAKAALVVAVLSLGTLVGTGLYVVLTG